MNSEKYKELRERVIGILNEQPWVWNDGAKVISLVWLDDLIKMRHDPKLLSAEGLLNGIGRKMLTDPQDIYEVFKELQLINRNDKSLTLNMENAQPQRVGILAHLKSGNTLTGLQAIKLFGCYRLSGVIFRLNKNPAITIVCKIEPDHKYGIYSLVIPEKSKEIS